MRPGRSGQDPVAVALADAIRADFVGGAWWVDLSTTFDAGLVTQVVAATILKRDAER